MAGATAVSATTRQLPVRELSAPQTRRTLWQGAATRTLELDCRREEVVHGACEAQVAAAQQLLAPVHGPQPLEQTQVQQQLQVPINNKPTEV